MKLPVLQADDPKTIAYEKVCDYLDWNRTNRGVEKCTSIFV